MVMDILIMHKIDDVNFIGDVPNCDNNDGGLFNIQPDNRFNLKIPKARMPLNRNINLMALPFLDSYTCYAVCWGSGDRWMIVIMHTK